jgi:antitoxin MazE
MHIVRTPIIRIGNSRGIRIPKLLIEQLGLGAEVELILEDDRLVIRSPSSARRDWEAQFRAMAERGDDRLLDDAVPTIWDATEWEW